MTAAVLVALAIVASAAARTLHLELAREARRCAAARARADAADRIRAELERCAVSIGEQLMPAVRSMAASFEAFAAAIRRTGITFAEVADNLAEQRARRDREELAALMREPIVDGAARALDRVLDDDREGDR
jgi:hypothetical protein